MKQNKQTRLKIALAKAIINQYGYSKGPVWFINLTIDNIKQVAQAMNSPLCELFSSDEKFKKCVHQVIVLVEDWHKRFAINNVLLKFDKGFTLISDFQILRELERIMGDNLFNVSGLMLFGNNSGKYYSHALAQIKGQYILPDELIAYNRCRNKDVDADTHNYQAYGYGVAHLNFPFATSLEAAPRDKELGYVPIICNDGTLINKYDEIFGDYLSRYSFSWHVGAILCQKLTGVEDIVPRLMYYLLEDIARGKLTEQISRPVYSSSGYLKDVEILDVPLQYPTVLLSQRWAKGEVFFPVPDGIYEPIGHIYYKLPDNFPNHKTEQEYPIIKLPQAISDMANAQEPYWHRLCSVKPWKFHWWDDKDQEFCGEITHASLDTYKEVHESAWNRETYLTYFSTLEFKL